MWHILLVELLCTLTMNNVELQLFEALVHLCLELQLQGLAA